MKLSKLELKTRMNTILDTEVLDRIEMNQKYRMDSGRSMDKASGFETPFLHGTQRIKDPNIFKGNIEKFYGMTQVPMGLAGPLKVNGAYASDKFHVPMATTEGALVASYNRGARVITLSGGANVLCISEVMTRSPGFVFDGLLSAARFVAWVSENFEVFKDIARSTTQHGHLESFDAAIDGKYVWINLKFVTGDAAGQNMVTIASDAICRFILANSPVAPKTWYIDANLSGDKKATRFSQYGGRGKNVLAEITIERKIVEKFLHTTPEAIVAYAQMSITGGLHSGSIGSNGHASNALTAIFLACGQDVACVAESATGFSRAELTEDKDLYISVSMPNLVVGTVGGGTHLPTQKEALSIMGCAGAGQSKKFAEICAATVLAGEISIAAAMAAGHFTRAHKKYGRTKKVYQEETACPSY